MAFPSKIGGREGQRNAVPVSRDRLLTRDKRTSSPTIFSPYKLQLWWERTKQVRDPFSENEKIVHRKIAQQWKHPYKTALNSYRSSKTRNLATAADIPRHHLSKCNGVADLKTCHSSYVLPCRIWSVCVKRCRHKYRRSKTSGCGAETQCSIGMRFVADYKTHAPPHL